MAIQRNDFAVRIFTVIRGIVFVFHPQRRTGVLVATKDRLLLLERRPIPELHVKLDNSRRLIAAAHGPGRLVLIGCHPHYLIHQRAVVARRVSGAVLKPQQVDGGLFAFAARRAVGDKPFPLPAHAQQIRRMFDDITQGVDHRILSIGADLQQQVAMAQRGIQRIVGEAGHRLQLFRRFIRETKALIK